MILTLLPFAQLKRMLFQLAIDKDDGAVDHSDLFTLYFNQNILITLLYILRETAFFGFCRGGGRRETLSQIMRQFQKAAQNDNEHSKGYSKGK
jgi:hypothetical protein